VPFLALTATATPQVRRDICKSLKLKNPCMTCSSFDRPNLFLSVDLKRESMGDDMMHLAIRDGFDYKFDGPTIIYCPTKKDTESVTRTLEGNFYIVLLKKDDVIQFLVMKISCGMYHAGLPLQMRKQVHENFVKDKIQVVVATVAFGMGIDKPGQSAN
jgi:superfamily II DNA helicase RecQ